MEFKRADIHDLENKIINKWMWMNKFCVKSNEKKRPFQRISWLQGVKFWDIHWTDIEIAEKEQLQARTFPRYIHTFVVVVIVVLVVVVVVAVNVAAAIDTNHRCFLFFRLESVFGRVKAGRNLKSFQNVLRRSYSHDGLRTVSWRAGGSSS